MSTWFGGTDELLVYTAELRDFAAHHFLGRLIQKRLDQGAPRVYLIASAADNILSATAEELGFIAIRRWNYEKVLRKETVSSKLRD